MRKAPLDIPCRIPVTRPDRELRPEVDPKTHRAAAQAQLFASSASCRYANFDCAFETGAVNTEEWDEGLRVSFERGYVEVLVVPPLLRAPSRHVY